MNSITIKLFKKWTNKPSPGAGSAGCPGPWASGRAGREDGHGPLLVAGDQPLSRSGPGGGGEHRAQVEVCTWSGAMSPQSRTTRGQAELLPRESQSWVTHPAPIQADIHIRLITQPPSPEFPGITFHIRKKEPPSPLASMAMSPGGGAGDNVNSGRVPPLMKEIGA